ncbi:hypothetical protein EJ357_02050 [Streptomyces cyaneochromogenes]|uniref:Trehalose-phosphatase n=1 Tax=Streptomyces cyaneochromogenes TaxID=2496836 RepID=A0A3S5HT91_9ACTN|nr:trehalose-phosphatase [Streptomyces cyaneochromogenes]AZQ32380.1 hypothetical protein EJ357_02050 [Streptomyces cyaneochromogenes]
MSQTAHDVGRPAQELRASGGRPVAPFPAAQTLILTDLDGTLLPANAPSSDMARHQADLHDLCRLLLAQPHCAVVCVTGRRALNARDILAAPLWIAGVHGAELLAPYAGAPLPHPRMSRPLPEVRRLARDILELDLCPAEMHVEDKGVVLAVHHPHLPADRAAVPLARLISLARASGLVVVAGRGWTEIRPPCPPHKGDVVVEMVRRWRPRRVIVAGDDHSDVAMFDAAGRLREAGLVEQAICVAVSTPGAAPECIRRAHVVLEGPAECRAWFRGGAHRFTAPTRTAGWVGRRTRPEDDRG